MADIRRGTPGLTLAGAGSQIAANPFGAPTYQQFGKLPVASPGGFSPVGPASYSGMFMSGGGMPDPTQLMNDYNSKYAEAKQANESRYAQGMQGYGDLYNRGMGRLDQLSSQNRADIMQAGDKSKAANTAKMNALGLAGTTVGSTLNAGIDKDTAAGLNRVNDAMVRERNATDADLETRRLGFLERRNDPYPEMGSYAQMMAMLGKTSALGGGGAGAGSGGGMYGGGMGGMGGFDSGGYGMGAGLPNGGSQPMSGMYVANTNGSYGGATGGGQTIYGNADEIARAGRLRQAGSITGDNLDSLAMADRANNTARWGSPASTYSQLYGAGNPGIWMQSFNGRR